MASNFGTSPVIPSRVRTPFGRRMREVLSKPGQILVWVATGALALWLSVAPGAQRQVVGIVQANEARLAFGSSGTIEEVLVAPGAIVSIGTLLARLDGSLLDARLVVLEHEVAAVAADLAASASAHRRLAAQRTLENQLVDTDNGFDEAANSTRREDALVRLEIEARERRLSALAIEVEIDTTRLAAERVSVQLHRARQLADDDAGPAARAEDLELRERELLGNIAANERLFETTRSEATKVTAQAEAMRAAVEGAPRTTDLSPERRAFETATAAADIAALHAIERRLELRRAEFEALRVELAGLYLRSSIGGRVETIEAFAGQTVMAGAPVVTVRSQEAESVIVYLPEPSAGHNPLPDSVALARVSAPRPLIEARVLGFGTGVARMPERLWTRPGIPSYGRPLVVAPPKELGLIPGEVVMARLP